MGIQVAKEHELEILAKTRFLLFQQKLFLALAVATTLFLVAFRFETELWATTPVTPERCACLASPH